MTPSKTLNNYDVYQQRNLLLPGIVAILGLNIFLIIYSLHPEMPSPIALTGFTLGVFAIIFTLINYFFFFPRFYKIPIYYLFLTIIAFICMAVIIYIEPFLFPGVSTIFGIILVILLSMITSRFATYGLALFVLISQLSLRTHGGFFENTHWMNYFSFPVITMVLTETLSLLQHAISKKMRRLEILNNVARSLASSLETHQVIALVSSAIQNAMDADTYYLGLLKNDKIRLELFYDDGEFFPTVELDLEESLAGWVIKKNQSLLVKDLVKDAKEKNLPIRIIGKQRYSLSWLGTPLGSGSNVLGIIAIASYRKNAFDQADLELIQNLSQQAAMAIDNAYHHAEVETRSQTDSLTGTLNHNAYLLRLRRTTEENDITQPSISLIMLDIDHFKQYNDQYGHLIGDQVLMTLAQTIKKHIKKTDLVGRWGGEEFSIALPGASPRQALEIAQRIQNSLSKIQLFDRNHQAILAPTISQGIAVYPQEANEIYALIDLADQRLYLAKERGRNQIEPQPDLWDQANLPEN